MVVVFDWIVKWFCFLVNVWLFVVFVLKYWALIVDVRSVILL